MPFKEGCAVAAMSPAEQSTSQPIADNESAANVKHPEEDEKDDEFLDAGSPAKKPRRKRMKKAPS